MSRLIAVVMEEFQVAFDACKRTFMLLINAIGSCFKSNAERDAMPIFLEDRALRALSHIRFKS